MKYPTLVLFIISLFALTSCDKEAITPSGNTINTQQAIKAFDALDVIGPFEVRINFSDSKYDLSFEGDEQYLDKVIVEEKGNALKIRLEKNTVLKNNAIIKVNLTSNQITTYAGIGETTFLLEDDLDAKKVDIHLSGESAFNAHLTTDRLALNATGESTISISGSAKEADLHLTGSANFKDYDFSSEEMNIVLSGESQAYTTIKDQLDVLATGESVLNYKGSPQVSKVVTGEATVKKVE